MNDPAVTLSILSRSLAEKLAKLLVKVIGILIRGQVTYLFNRIICVFQQLLGFFQADIFEISRWSHIQVFPERPRYMLRTFTGFLYHLIQ